MFEGHCNNLVAMLAMKHGKLDEAEIYRVVRSR